MCLPTPTRNCLKILPQPRYLKSQMVAWLGARPLNATHPSLTLYLVWRTGGLTTSNPKRIITRSTLYQCSQVYRVSFRTHHEWSTTRMTRGSTFRRQGWADTRPTSSFNSTTSHRSRRLPPRTFSLLPTSRTKELTPTRQVVKTTSSRPSRFTKTQPHASRWSLRTTRAKWELHALMPTLVSLIKLSILFSHPFVTCEIQWSWFPVEIIELSSCKIYKQEIFNGTIEAFNPLPSILRFNTNESSHDSSLDRFEKRLVSLCT